MKREKKITFRVSEYERKLILGKLKKSGIRLSDFCRYAVLGKEVKYIDGLPECSFELNKIGNNLNQITLLMHQRIIQNPNLEDMSRQLAEVINKIYEVLGGEEHSHCEACQGQDGQSCRSPGGH